MPHDARQRFMEELLRRRGQRPGQAPAAPGVQRPATVPQAAPQVTQTARGADAAQQRAASFVGSDVAAQLAALSPEARRARIQEIRRERMGQGLRSQGSQVRPSGGATRLRPGALREPATEVRRPRRTLR